jgi:hypothetical protein
MANTIEAEIVIAYPGPNGGNWQVLRLTTAQAEYIQKQLELNLGNGQVRENPRAYAQ